MDAIHSLLTILPDDAGRDELFAATVRRERQYHDVARRAVEIRQRITDLSDEIPDATAKQRTTLLQERRDLLAERAALPLDATVAARLYSDALIALSVAVTAAATTERRAVRADLDRTQGDHNRLEYDLKNGQPGTAHYDRTYDDFQKLSKQRTPSMERLAKLDALRDAMKEYVKTALASPDSKARPGGVKMMDGRPVDGYVAAFVAHAGKAVA